MFMVECDRINPLFVYQALFVYNAHSFYNERSIYNKRPVYNAHLCLLCPISSKFY